MNEKITAELDLPGVGLGAGVTVGCLLACYSEPMVRCVWLFISAAVLAFSLFTGKRRFLAAGLLLGLVSMTVYQTWVRRVASGARRERDTCAMPHNQRELLQRSLVGRKSAVRP